MSLRVPSWFCTAVFACSIASVAHAQELELPVSPTPIGAGARAAGMADAFVAIADDATAASWNPAGLVQLELPELSLVGQYNAIEEVFHASFHSEFDSTHRESGMDINYLSFVYPLPLTVLNRNVTLALTYQRKYDLSRNFNADYQNSIGSVGFLGINNHDFEQKGGLSTLTPAVAFELTPTLSLGLSLNLWRSTWFSDNGWEQTYTVTSDTFRGANFKRIINAKHEEYEDFQGENATLGLLWNFRPKWNLGIRYDTAFTGTVDYTLTSLRREIGIPGFPRAITSVYNPGRPRSEKRRVHFPDTLAVGIAHRPNDRLTLSLDVTRTDWNDFTITDARGRRISLVDAGQQSQPFDINFFNAPPSKFKPTTTVRFGAEYVFIPKNPDEELNRLWTLRGGLFYDEEPASGRSNTSGRFRRPNDNGDPDPFYGATFGVGLLLHQRVNLDFAYQARIGKGVNSDFFRGIPGYEEDVIQHRVLLSTVIYF